MFARRSNGFTLVELLVVMTIIGILIALLVPAVQSARESARRAKCQNNVKQMALACQSHLSHHGFFPTGGWGWKWAGEPSRGFNLRQPGGWHYNILPYIELQAIHDLGMDPATHDDELVKRIGTPVPIYICPTRRPAGIQACTATQSWYNLHGKPAPLAGKSDYAACGGALPCGKSWGTTPTSGTCKAEVPGNEYKTVGGGPQSLSEGDNKYDAAAWSIVFTESDGVIFRHSECRPEQILKGTTSTYLLGERHLNPYAYFYSREQANDQAWDVGYDCDTSRWTCWKWDASTGTCSDDTYMHTPRPDTVPDNGRDAASAGWEEVFGSAHVYGFNMAMCDGSVHMINYSIDKDVHARLGSRRYTSAVNLSTVPMR